MRTVVVGAGFAGLATAYHLARRGVKDLLVVEREQGSGYHASGRNAGLLRQSSGDPAVADMLRRGSRFARRLLARIPGGIISKGSLILGPDAHKLHAGPRARVIDASTCVEGLEGDGLYDPDDAIIDPHTLLQAYESNARAHGVAFAYGEEVRAFTRRDGRMCGVVTEHRTLDADAVVIAAGAWAGNVGRRAGATSPEFVALRRHLFHAELDRDSSHWPFVWDDARGVYFLPEGRGLLASPCDTDPHPAAEPRFDSRQRDVLAHRLLECFDDLGRWRLGPGWACLRTFAPDHRFVIGWDPQWRGLFWVAGLGGHGVTASWAIGRYAAGAFLRTAPPGPFDPARFAPE